MKNKLIELLRKIPPMEIKVVGRGQGRTYQTAEHIADYLLANGVIVPPCKIGADVWWLDKEEGTVECEKNGIKAVCYDGKKWTAITCDASDSEDIGTDWLMLTKEEAEERLERWKDEKAD